MSEPISYILRIQRDELERQLFAQRIFYVNISRAWSRDTIVLFVKKDTFIGSGVIEKFVTMDALEEPEKRLCTKNNWYGKILFGRLTRFIPPILVMVTPAAEQNALALHGASISHDISLRIGRMAAGRIVS